MHSNKITYKKYYVSFLSTTKNYIKVDASEFYNLSEACSHLQKVKTELKEGKLYTSISKDERLEILKNLCICEQSFVEKLTWTKLKPVVISKNVLK